LVSSELIFSELIFSGLTFSIGSGSFSPDAAERRTSDIIHGKAAAKQVKKPKKTLCFTGKMLYNNKKRRTEGGLAWKKRSTP
jgi:hypothetical protein